VAALTRYPAGLLAGAGLAAAAAAAAIRPAEARMALGQDWSAFVLVAGLLLIGLVADGDGLFAAAGHRIGTLARSGWLLFAGAACVVAAVTAVLNLDTSVAFLTPVLVHAARSRGSGQAPLLFGCLLLSNAGSLLLPGSNLTNLIVLGHLRLTGGQFLARMWLPWLAALIVTATVIGVAERRALRVRPAVQQAAAQARLDAGLVAVAAAAVLVLVLRSPALPVAAIGVAAAGLRLIQHRDTLGRVAGVLGIPVLAGLLGVSVALGTLGRAWSGPAVLLAHLGVWTTAAFAAMASVLVNNLPAASLLAARTPAHPLALLVGLNIGPNLLVIGSLAWILWLRAARSAGAQPSLRRASRLGLVAVPLSMAAAVAALTLLGTR
jgi:arsenical pump membrane protein